MIMLLYGLSRAPSKRTYMQALADVGRLKYDYVNCNSLFGSMFILPDFMFISILVHLDNVPR